MVVSEHSNVAKTWSCMASTIVANTGIVMVRISSIVFLLLSQGRLALLYLAFMVASDFAWLKWVMPEMHGPGKWGGVGVAVMCSQLSTVGGTVCMKFNVTFEEIYTHRHMLYFAYRILSESAVTFAAAYLPSAPLCSSLSWHLGPRVCTDTTVIDGECCQESLRRKEVMGLALLGLLSSVLGAVALYVSHYRHMSKVIFSA